MLTEMQKIYEIAANREDEEEKADVLDLQYVLAPETRKKWQKQK